MKGRVYLVGAGPGDPDLLTLRALRALRQADVVLHDALVSPEILELVPSRVMVVNVGKRCGSKAITQEQINTMLVSFAAAGNCVVRLKAGDPLIFGRAGERLSICNGPESKLKWCLESQLRSEPRQLPRFHSLTGVWRRRLCSSVLIVFRTFPNPIGVAWQLQIRPLSCTCPEQIISG